MILKRCCFISRSLIKIIKKFISKKEYKNQNRNQRYPLQNFSYHSWDKEKQYRKNKQRNHRNRTRKWCHLLERHCLVVTELDIDQSTRKKGCFWKFNLMDKKGIIYHMIIIISINFCSLNNIWSIDFLERIFDVHINAKHRYKSDSLQKINALWKEVIIASILQTKFWFWNICKHQIFSINKILSYYTQNW